MKRLQRLGLLTSILLVAACKGSETGFTSPNNGPFAYVRYVHAMPDTGAVVVRFVDLVENWVGTPTSGTALGVGYRTVTAFQGITPGSRHFKVWPATTDIVLTQDEIADVTFDFQANQYYTVLHTGYARCQAANPAQTVVVFQETPPTVSAGKFAIRALVAAPGFAASQDVYVTPTSTTPLPGSPTFSAMAYTQDPAALSARTWVEVDTGSAVIRSYNAGTTATANITSTAPAGAKATVSSTNDLPGSTITGSGLTAFIFPQAQTTACANTGTIQAVYAVDRRPPIPQ
jgi:uncharacterized protein DUF4397